MIDYFRRFKSLSAYTEYVNSSGYTLPNVSVIDELSGGIPKYKPKPKEPKPTYEDGWPIIDSINSMYSDRIKYPINDFKTNSDYIIFLIPSGTTLRSITTHDIVVCSPTEILAQTTLTNAPIYELAYGGYGGYFAYATIKNSFAVQIMKYDETNSTISQYKTISTSFNNPISERYAYYTDNTPHICLGKCNTRQTPGIVPVTGTSMTAPETGGMTFSRMITYNYSDTTKPFLSFIYHETSSGGEKNGVMVKSANSYGFGFSSDSTLAYTNCTAISNVLSNCNSFLAYPVFGKNPHNIENKIMFIHNGTNWYELTANSDFTSINYGNQVSCSNGYTVFFISDSNYYDCDSSANYNFVLKTVNRDSFTIGGPSYSVPTTTLQMDI